MADYIKFKSDDEERKTKKKLRPIFSFKSFLIIILLIFLISSTIESISYSMASKIALVPINGIIMTQKETSIYGSSISSREIAQILEDIKEDKTIKAVILDINSPGGSPVASEEISKAIESLKEKKPVYALINDVGASGAFWIAVSADKVYASSMSTVGSIGVTSAGLSFENFIREYNITYRKQTAGELKDMGTPFREPTQKEEEIIQNLLNEIHTNFIQHVATSRNMSFQKVQNYSTGEIFLGSSAKQIGFIDEIGYYPDVLKDIKDKVGDAMVVTYEPDLTIFQALGIESIAKFSPKSKSNIMLE